MSSNPFGVCLQPECHDVTPPPQLPSTFEMMKNLLVSSKQIIEGAVAGEGVIVDEEIFNSRLDICTACPLYLQDSSRCTQCGCYMKNKAMFKKMSCPIGKW